MMRTRIITILSTGLLLLVVGCEKEGPTGVEPTGVDELTNASGAIPSNLDLTSSPPDLGDPVLSKAYGAASITAISNPDAAYVSATTLIDISGIPNYTNVSSISDGLQIVSFSGSMDKRHAEVSGWLTWGDPPFTEILAPHVLYSNGDSSRTMTLSLATPTFGFEL